jgi:hypothetical protein
LGTSDDMKEEQWCFTEHLLCAKPMMGNLYPSPPILTLLHHSIATPAQPIYRGGN